MKTCTSVLLDLFYHSETDKNTFLTFWLTGGYLKRGINLNEHGLIYSSEKKPVTVKGIDKLPLKVKLSKGAERLNNPSYINYGRVYTVETNVKVKGMYASFSIWSLIFKETFISTTRFKCRGS